MTITISEGIQILKLLNQRHDELVNLRNANSFRETRYIGANAEKERVVEPTYDVKKLDSLVGQIAKEIRLLDATLKRANAATTLDYEWDDSKLGTIE